MPKASDDIACKMSRNFARLDRAKHSATMSAPSRFVSQDNVDEKKQREKELKEVYEWYVVFSSRSGLDRNLPNVRRTRTNMTLAHSTR